MVHNSSGEEIGLPLLSMTQPYFHFGSPCQRWSCLKWRQVSCHLPQEGVPVPTSGSGVVLRDKASSGTPDVMSPLGQHRGAL